MLSYPFNLHYETKLRSRVTATFTHLKALSTASKELLYEENMTIRRSTATFSSR